MKKLIRSLLHAGTFTGSTIALTQETFYRQPADSAFTLTRYRVAYDPSYFSMGYPNGDVPADRGGYERMWSSVPTANWASTCKKRFTKI
ncbi:MAG: DUF1287 domain-containing protein [Rikenellaceae bacterium]|nr:DUF1287 domain-containing protein [Rikenellaceae bacterium]